MSKLEKCEKCVYFSFDECSNCNYRELKEQVFKFKIDNDEYEVRQFEWLYYEGISIATSIKKNGKVIMHSGYSCDFFKDENEAVEMVKAFNEVK